MLFLAVASGKGTNDKDSLYENFKNPPKANGVRVWWHWIDGNITGDGIRNDLFWMDRAGVSGFQHFDIGGSLTIRPIVDRRLTFMSPKWKEVFWGAITLGDSLGMEMGIASSSGWSQTGGPWGADEDAMKRLCWRDTLVDGGRKLRLVLPKGYDNLGAYQDCRNAGDVFPEKREDGFYRDVAVIAVKMPSCYRTLIEMNPSLTTSGGGQVSIEQLSNDDLNDYVTLESDEEGWCWVQFAFPEPQTIRSFTCLERRGEKQTNQNYSIQASDDGVNFREVDAFGFQGTIMKTHNIPATTSRWFRFRIRNGYDGGPSKVEISNLVPFTVNQVEAAGDKAAFSLFHRVNDFPTPFSSIVVAKDDVIDLTGRFMDGILTWNAPFGRWKILRFGFGLTGEYNEPGSPEGTGLEVDKMDPIAIGKYYKHFLQMYQDASRGKMGEKGISYLLNDSFEAGFQNWTRDMVREFRNRRGYDLLPWLPALQGVIIGSSEETDRFLFDWRITLGELQRDYHYDALEDILKPYGLKRYTEGHENGRALFADGMDIKRTTEVPMSAIWISTRDGRVRTARDESDIRESASVAHIYGQNVVAGESFSVHGSGGKAYLFHPGSLKPIADFAMAAGQTRFVIHESAHQPRDDKFPGLGLGKFGQWFNRHETWAEMAHAWTGYLARSGYLLEQGRSVADVIVYYGEDTNVTALYQDALPQIPTGYNYDFASPSILKEELKADNGKIVTASGQEYQVLWLENADYMSMSVLKKIACLAEAGVTIGGARPTRLAGMEGSPEVFEALVEKTWSLPNVSCGIPLEEILVGRGVSPDIECSPVEDIHYVHRRLEGGRDVYWLSNRSLAYHDVTVSFRTSGLKPVIWHPENGEKEQVSYVISGDRTYVKMHFMPDDALFVMFLEQTVDKEERLQEPIEAKVSVLDGRWSASFQGGHGAPEGISLNHLISLSKHPDPGVRYYSGVTTYRKDFQWIGLAMTGKIILDLGEVHDLAEVRLNESDLGVVWHAPFKVDITGALRKGTNKLEVKVANVWHNRLVGDVQNGVNERVTSTNAEFYKSEEPLLKSGLVGPVCIDALFSEN